MKTYYDDMVIGRSFKKRPSLKKECKICCRPFFSRFPRATLCSWACREENNARYQEEYRRKQREGSEA